MKQMSNLTTNPAGSTPFRLGRGRQQTTNSAGSAPFRLGVRTAIFSIIACCGLWLGCHDDSVNASLENTQYPTLDYAAFFVEEETAAEYCQVLLKMSLKQYRGDILKFGLSSPAAHQERLNYFIRDFKESIALVSGSDTFPCVDSHLERLHMDLPYRNFILTFKRSSLTDQDYLLIKDTEYSHQQIKLSIDKSYD